MPVAIEVHATGGPEVLSAAEVDVPTPGPGELVVDTGAAGVNFIDVYHRNGTYPLDLPFVAGVEGAGTVREVGADVTDLAVGDRVAWSMVPGSYAEQVVVPAASAVRVPDGVDVETAAAAMLQGLTAHYLATSVYPIGAGDTAVVHAAAGGVGLLLTQLIKAAGGTVIATASTADKQQLAREAGANTVVGYGEFGQAAADLTNGRGVDVVYDGVGKATFEGSLDALRVRGTLALFGAASGPVPPFDPQRLNSAGSVYLTRPSLAHFIADAAELRWRCDELFGAIRSGDLSVRVGGRYRLSDAAAAHADLEARRTTGKLLLVP